MSNSDTTSQATNNKQTHNTPPIEERTVPITVHVTPNEFEFIKTITNILASLDVTGNNQAVINEDNISEFTRFAITWVGGIYQTQIFPDSRIISKIKGKDSKKTFIAFREKYMNYPTDAQLQELKGLGLVRSKHQK
jgi:hypothetical protein